MGFPLPPELTSIVLKYLTDDEAVHAAPYATVNRCWQTIIERRTFSDLQIGTAKRLAEFNQMSWNRRWCYVRDIYFFVELESYDGEARMRYESEEEMQIFNSADAGVQLQPAPAPLNDERRGCSYCISGLGEYAMASMIASMHNIHAAYLLGYRGSPTLRTLHLRSCRLAGDTDSIE
ncbi:unnamed protein product [Penicillium glandicola]